MKWILVVLLGWVLAGSFVGCNKPFGPVTPAFPPTPTMTPSPAPTAYPTPHATPSYNPPSTGIYLVAEAQTGVINSNVRLNVNLSVNGAPETTDTVTLTTPSGSMPATFVQNAGNNSQYSGSISSAYVPGGTYTLTAVTSIGTAVSTLTAPGTMSIAANGSLATWSPEGNQDYLWIYGPGGISYESYATTEDIDSPFSVPASAYPASGTYYVYGVAQQTTTNVTGADAGSYFTFSSFIMATVAK